MGRMMMMDAISLLNRVNHAIRKHAARASKEVANQILEAELESQMKKWLLKNPCKPWFNQADEKNLRKIYYSSWN
ncbi:hypothetical protein TSUD_239350 [Trifolium subterraneum]|uniref:Uncharacterized protein n=1 Tax=Trifolium subterraneum TaxID=3900 RepID=A0A2Z6P2U1_TRISU|nr:hypothetical protein TSUD_239350 [Trifolium subterraneum]